MGSQVSLVDQAKEVGRGPRFETNQHLNTFNTTIILWGLQLVELNPAYDLK